MNKVSTTHKHSNARYYVFEGADGAGKTTQTRMLVEYLQDLFGTDRVLLTSQPWYQGRQGDKIKQFLRKELVLTGEQAFNLYVGNRVHHLTDIVIPALERGEIVAQDRSFYSAVYQTTQGISLQRIVEAHKDMEVADRVFILQTSLDTAQARLRERHQATGHAPETFETREEQRKIAEHFSKMIDYFPEHPLSFINAEGSADEVHGLVKQVLQSDVQSLLSNIPDLVIQNRLYTALQKSGRGGVMREVAKWRGDDRYEGIVFDATCILSQHGLSP